MYIPRLFPSSWLSSLFSPNHNHPPTVSPVPSSNCRPTTDPRTLSTLQKLPPEIRLMIKDSIPLTDLRTHVSFYKTSPQFAALYGADEGRQRAFWASACLAVGIGGPPIMGEHGHRMGDMYMGETDWDWRLIAFTCIEADGWCTHPQCGVSRLKWNAKQIQATMNLPDFSRPAFHKYLQSVCRQDVDPELGVLTSPVFEYVSFHCEPKRNIFEDALLDYRDGDLANEENPANLLVKHPIASWSFATFPVVHSLFMENRFYTHDLEMDWIGVQNANGVTVFDVMNHIFWRLGKHLMTAQLNEELPEGHFNTALGELYLINDIQALRRIETLRLFYYYFRPNGFKTYTSIWHDRVDDGPILAIRTRVARITRPRTASGKVVSAEDDSTWPIWDGVDGEERDPLVCETIAAENG